MTDAINNASQEPQLSNEHHCMAALTAGTSLPPLPRNHHRLMKDCSSTTKQLIAPGKHKSKF